MRERAFDDFTKMFATRAHRRTVLGGAIAAISAAGLVSSFTAMAQEPATPVPSFEELAELAAGASSAEFLFVQSFQSGSWVPKPGEDGVFVLTVTGVPGEIIYFTDRPERIFGIVPTQQFLDSLGFTLENPPNAALVAMAEPGSTEQEVLLIQLLAPVYDENTATMTYEAKVLADYSGAGLAHLADQHSDTIHSDFAHGSLFIDDCGTTVLDCGTCGPVVTPSCWNPSYGMCSICLSTSKEMYAACESAYPGCKA